MTTSICSRYKINKYKERDSDLNSLYLFFVRVEPHLEALLE
jgi:hypothetical protein